MIVPFWTSLLIRTYAWIYILGGRGIPAVLEWIGLEGVRLINTPGAVLVGIVYGYLPLMVFPIYVSLEKLDKSLLEASNDLGGQPLQNVFAGHLATFNAGRGHGLHAGFYPADGRVSDSGISGRRKSVFHWQCDG